MSRAHDIYDCQVNAGAGIAGEVGPELGVVETDGCKHQVLRVQAIKA